MGSGNGELFGAITSLSGFSDLLLRIRRASAARLVSERSPGPGEQPSAKRPKTSHSPGRGGGAGGVASRSRKLDRLASDLHADGPGSSAKR